MKNQSSLSSGVSRTLLKETTSRCPACKAFAPASVYKTGPFEGREQIILERTCATHGTSSNVISSDARFYWLAKGNDLNRDACCASVSGRSGTLGSNALTEAKHGTLEKLSTCLALIEVTDSCNLACPTCFADSPVGASEGRMKYSSLDDLTKRIQGVIDRKGHIELLQLSGGEPTIHPEFIRLVEWIRRNPGIDYLLVNTNGVRFAKDDAFLAEMGRMQQEHDNIQLYLQFDGPQAEGQHALRGTDLREVRERAIARCASVGIPITLAMTVTPLTLPFIGRTVDYGLRHENVRGVSFQPVFLSGRVPVQVSEAGDPISVADIILGLHEQSGGSVRLDDWTPLPCGDPNCATIGWVFRVGGRRFSPSEVGIDIPRLQASLPDRVNYDIEDLKRCGCENTALGDLMKRLEVDESNVFRLFIKPFMDSRSWDEDRIDRCCTHIIRPDGKLDSFCRYYLGAPEGQEKRRIALASLS